VTKQQASEEVGVASQGGQEVVVGGEASADMGGTKPTGDGTSSLGEESAEEQDGESSGVPLVQEEGHASDQILPEQREEGKIHSSSPGWERGRVSTPILARRTSSCQKVVNAPFIGDYDAFLESAERK
jgi:hypothetical protein